MSDKDKKDAKPAHSPVNKDDPHDLHKDEHKTTVQTGTFANVPHQQAVEEGVKASVSHRQTTQDVVEADREPVKSPPPHALVGKMTKLMDEVADVAKKHKEEVLDLRDKLQKLLFEVPNDMPHHSVNSFHSVATKVEEGINMLDPDCTARAPQ